MTDYNETLQNKVNDFIKHNHLLKKDFAAKIGITPVMLSHWLGGRASLSRKSLERIVALICQS